MHRVRNTTAVALLFFGIMHTGAAAAEPQYKEYQATSTRTEFFWIAFDDQVIVITVPEEGGTRSYEIPLESVEHDAAEVRLASGIRFDATGLEIKGTTFAYDDIVDMRVFDDDEGTSIVFYRGDSADPDIARLRRGNMIRAFDNVRVEEGSFVRGFIFSVTGDIDVFGEVNKDIVTLFGGIYVAPDAVARGDVASVTGKVQIARDASVYGIVYTGTTEQKGRSRRFYRSINESSLSGTAYYNRVDGFTPLARFEYRDRDSLLPNVVAEVGYAFESKRSRLRFGVEQTLWREMPMAIGGVAYKELATEDEWLLSRNENNVYTLLVTEDFRDYYERTGGYLYYRVKPVEYLQIETGYRYDETRWFEAERDLWSLFGGDKKFPRNFHRVDPSIRDRGIAEIDTGTTAGLVIRGAFDTRDEKDPYDFSAWNLTGQIEWSDDKLSSDYDYRRYQFSAARYQEIHSRIMLISRLVVGASDGYLPMQKRYYMGGLGTLRGYKHKEFIGKRFWLANLEYRFRFPKSDFALGVLYDVGQISNDSPLNGDVEWKQSLGGALYIGDDFRVSLAQRLDGAEDKDLQVYARCEHSF